MTGVALISPRRKFVDSSGNPIAGGSLTVYYAGTTNLATTYQDQALTTANTNPITLDANGECVVWVDDTFTYKELVKDSTGATVSGYPVDNVRGGGASISGVSEITVDRFSGTGVQTQFTLSVTPTNGENSTEVYVSGVYIQKNAYSLAGNVLTFAVAPANGTNNIEVNTFGYTDYTAAATAVAASASAAATSATAAATSATASASSATAAAASATAADASADAAAVSEAQAAAIVLGNFQQSGTGSVARTFTNKIRELTIDAQDFGAAVDGVTDDLPELDAMSDYALANSSGKTILNRGDYLANGTWNLQPTSGFGSIDVTGPAGAFLGNAQINHGAAQNTNPLINIQAGRSVRLSDFEIRGNNVAPSNLANTGTYNVSNHASWLTASMSEGRYNPYAGIAYDALAGTDPGVGNNYTFGSYGQGTSSKGFIERMRVQNFTVGIAIHPTQNDSGTEDIIIRDTSVIECKYAIVNTASQQRNIIVDNTNVNGAWCGFDAGVTYGVRSGPPITVRNSILGHIYRLFQFHQAIGVGVVENNYCESVSSIGFFGEAGSSARMPMSSRSNNYSLVGVRDSSSAGQKDAVVKHYMPTKHDGDAFNDQYGHLVYPGNGSLVTFHNCGFMSEQNGTGEREGFQIFTPQALEHLVSCRGVFQRSFSTTTKYFDDEVVTTTIPSRAYIGRNTRLLHRLTDRTSYKLSGGIAGTVTASVTGLTYVDEDTLTGTETTAVKVMYVGARLYVRLRMPVRPGVADEVAIFPAALVTAFDSGTGAFTAKLLGEADTSYAPASLDIYIPHFINGTQATGDITSASNSITNVTNITNFAVNDWIRTTALSAPRRITAIGGTTLTMHTTMTATTAGTGLFNTPLTLI